MAQHKCIDHRTGITYVYDVEKITDESTGQTVTKRRMIGRLDDDGNVIPTSGRRGRLPKKKDDDASLTLSQAEELKEEIRTLKNRNTFLENKVAELEKTRRLLTEGMAELLKQAGFHQVLP